MALSTLLIALALVTSVAFAAMAFTRWGRKRPLHRYGALSIAAHLLLLAGLASVRTGGPPQSGAEDAPPVRIKIVMQTTTPTDPKAEAIAEPVPTPEPEPEQIAEAAEPIEEPVPEPEPPTPQEAVAVAPATTDSNEPDYQSARNNPDQAWSGLPEELVVAAEPALPTPEASTEIASETPPAEPETITVAPPEPRPIERKIEATAPPAESSIATASPLTPATYAQRGELQQRRLSADQGGTQETLDAVASAVDWFARAQRPDGAWDAARWGAGRETKTLGHNRRNAGMNAETGLTGLALLALGGAGHTHLDGPYRDTVREGLQFLLDHQDNNGDLAGNATLYARMYCHSMATFALAEAMAVSGDERLRPAVEAAVDFLARARNRAGGGWRYETGTRGDMSQMGWAVMALRSAELAGVAVRPDVWEGSERFVASVRRGQHGGLAAYQPQGRVSNTMTAEAMYCRQILGVAQRRGAANAEAVVSLVGDLPGSPSRRGGRTKPNFYYWYYATLALHHHRSHGEIADRAWREWNESMQRAVLPKQVAQGGNRGSWGADTMWGGYGGRVYATALATMCLEVYYRYDPETIGRDPWIAAREGVLRR